MSSDVDTGPIQAGASAPTKRVSGCCMYWRSPFFVAAEEGDVEEVIKFLREDATLLKQADKKDRRTAWHIAAAHGHVEVLRALVDRTRGEGLGLAWGGQPTLSSRIRAAAAARDAPGPDERVSELVNGRASRGLTPLALAAEQDHANTAKYLLSVGADPWLSDNEGRNPAHYAAKAGALGALQVLLEADKPLTSRASNRNHPGTRYVDSLDMYGFTPLHYATWSNRKSVMMLLVGFDANIITRSLLLHTDYYNLPAGSTPLHIACLLGDLDRVKMLLRAYYETAADLLPSQTALLGTVERRRRARSHPDPRLILTRTQRLPFHIAARAGHRELLDWLDPSVPLMFLFGGEEDGAAGGGREGGMVALVGVSRLTVIAAKALHQALLDSLDVAAEDIRRHEEAAEARRRRREERRLAREAEEAAQSLKQGKEPPPDGIRGRIRRLMKRASKDGGGAGAGGGGGAAAGSPTTAGEGRGGGGGGSEAPSTGWRPWRSRGVRRGRRKGTSDAAAAGADGGQQHSAGPRSPRRRRRRSALGMAGRGAAGNGGRGAAAAEIARTANGGGGSGAPGAAAAADDDGNSSCSGNSSDGGDGAEGDRCAQSPKQQSEVQQQQQQQPPRPSASGVLNGSLRLRIFRGSGSQCAQQQPQSQPQSQPQQQQQQQPQQRPSNTGRDSGSGGAAEGPDAATSAAAGAAGGGAADGGGGAAAGAAGGGGGGVATSLTRTMLQRLYRGSLRRPSSDTASLDPAQAQLNVRLNRAGITIPEGPDEAVAYFTPGREPRYNMPTQILLPASAFNFTSLRTSESALSPISGRPSLTITITTTNTTTTATILEATSAADAAAAATATTTAAAATGDVSAPTGCATDAATTTAAAASTQQAPSPETGAADTSFAGADASSSCGKGDSGGGSGKGDSGGGSGEGDGGGRCVGDAGPEVPGGREAGAEARTAVAGVAAAVVPEHASVVGGTIPAASDRADGPAAAAAEEEAAAADAGAGGSSAVGSRAASHSTSAIVAELLSHRSLEAGAAAVAGTGADAVAASCGGQLAAAAASEAARCPTGGPHPKSLAPAGPGPRPRSCCDSSDPASPLDVGRAHAQAADFTSVEHLAGEDLSAATAASSPREPGPAGLEAPGSSAAAAAARPPRPGSAAAPLRPRPSPLTAPSGDFEDSLLLLAGAGRSEPIANLDLDLIPGRKTPDRQPGRPDLSPADANAAAVASVIRSPGGSLPPSRRSSMQLPGTAAAARATCSILPSPSSLLPPAALPPVRRLSGDDVPAERRGGSRQSGGGGNVGGAAAAAAISSSQLLDGLPQLEEYRAGVERGGATSADRGAADAGVSSVEVGNDAAGTANGDGGWSVSAGMGRVSASARQLFNSVRTTLRRTSGQHQAQVVPVAHIPRSPSPKRRYHHHHHRRNRTPDSSVHRGRSPGRSPAVAAGSSRSPARGPGGPAVNGTAAAAAFAGGGGGGGAGGDESPARDAIAEVPPSSPNPSHHRGNAPSHPHTNLAARGVRVATGRPHARLSLFGRTGAGSHVESASVGSAGGAAAGRRVALPLLLVPSGPQGEVSAAAQGDAEAGRIASEAQLETQLQLTTAAAEPVAQAASATALHGVAEAEPPLRAGDAAASSFSSSGSREAPSSGTTAADDDEDVCPVCLDEAPNLLVQTCRHQICMDCARDLIRRHSLTPALCPYCRGIISSFKARVAAGPAPRCGWQRG